MIDRDTALRDWIDVCVRARANQLADRSPRSRQRSGETKRRLDELEQRRQLKS